MKKFNVKFQENKNEFEATIEEKNILKSKESKYFIKSLIVSKNDDKLIELSSFENFIAWFLGNKFFEIKTISSNEFEVIAL